MRVVALAADNGPCGWYRIKGPGAQLIADGADLKIEEKENNILALKSAETGALRDVRGIDPDVDVVVIQRPLARAKAELVGVLQAKGIAVVVEIDDHVGAIARGNLAFNATNPEHNPNNNYTYVAKACAQADLVTVTTSALGRVYAGHGRVAHLPNAVPESWLDIVPPWPLEDKIIGWPGTVATHPEDLQSTKGAVAAAVKASGWTFRAVGDGFKVANYLRLDDIEATGQLSYDEYPFRISELDLGIVPLDRTPFNEAKSWLKGLEMAAVGVPFVASATEDYKRLARLGAGLTAEDPSDWKMTLKRLMGSKSMREDLAASGRAVAAEHTIERRAHLWWEAWEQALKNRRAA